jgi:hypothetical protein
MNGVHFVGTEGARILSRLFAAIVAGAVASGAAFGLGCGTGSPAPKDAGFRDAGATLEAAARELDAATDKLRKRPLGWLLEQGLERGSRRRRHRGAAECATRTDLAVPGACRASERVLRVGPQQALAVPRRDVARCALAVLGCWA